jgi:hypothetical protein
VLAVHNFSDAPANFAVQLPKEAMGRGRWRSILGARDGALPEVSRNRLSGELPPYGYGWYGRRERA